MNSVRGMCGAAFLLLVSVFGCSDDSTPVSYRLFTARSDSTFTVGDSSTLEIGNFAGTTVVRTGDPGAVRVVAEKVARSTEDLGKIGVEMLQQQNGVRVTTDKPADLSNASVNVEVTAPGDARPSIQTGAGDVSYEGLAEGECFFATGAGTITLRLPPGVNVQVMLSVAAGSIQVDFPVVGQVNDHLVDGVIGTGADGRIVAQVGAGSIVVTSQ